MTLVDGGFFIKWYAHFCFILYKLNNDIFYIINQIKDLKGTVPKYTPLEITTTFPLISPCIKKCLWLVDIKYLTDKDVILD